MMKTLFAVGAILNSALYLSGVFVGSIVAHCLLAEYFALAATGATYITYILDLGSLESVAMWRAARYFRVVPLSLGVIAGMALILN